MQFPGDTELYTSVMTAIRDIAVTRDVEDRVVWEVVLASGVPMRRFVIQRRWRFGVLMRQQAAAVTGHEDGWSPAFGVSETHGFTKERQVAVAVLLSSLTLT